jgi:signal transduction histidine kinase
MAIVYRLVTEHGGRIEVESTQGAGTSVRVWLPVRADASGRAHVGAPPARRDEG